jgi:hypothetical protein
MPKKVVHGLGSAYEAHTFLKKQTSRIYPFDSPKGSSNSNSLEHIDKIPTSLQKKLNIVSKSKYKITPYYPS